MTKQERKRCPDFEESAQAVQPARRFLRLYSGKGEGRKKRMIMTFDSRVVSDVYVLTPRKNLVGGEETKALTSAVAALAAGPSPKVVMDLRRISWVSSLGIEGLRKIHRTCADHHGWLRLACAGERIENIILTMRLDWVFDTFDTVEEAIAAPRSDVRQAPPTLRLRPTN
jgi:anti-anti-sigma factor